MMEQHTMQPKPENHTVQCCICGSVRRDGRWTSAPAPSSRSISHTPCAGCAQEWRRCRGRVRVAAVKGERTGRDKK